MEKYDILYASNNYAVAQKKDNGDVVVAIRDGKFADMQAEFSSNTPTAQLILELVQVATKGVNRDDNETANN